MKSTGEVMGIDVTFGLAYAKAQLGSGTRLPRGGKVFISVRDEDKEPVARIAGKLQRLGFQIVATRGTAAYFLLHGISAETVKKVQEGSPNIAEAIKNGEIAMVINTPMDAHSHADSFHLRRNAVDYQVPYFTTIAGAEAAAEGIELLKDREFDVRPLQEYLAPDGQS
jgi:carbamoyl-phosphate synthase large subunit